jgi:hypothetical protein
LIVQCPNCGASSPDDKRFCSDCGALLDANFGAIKQYLDANLRREIQASLREDFRDQKLVQLETTEAIAEKLTSWAKLFAFFVGIPIFLALTLFGWLGFKSYSDFSKAISNATAEISVALKEAQELKKHADQIGTEYSKLDKQLQETSALAGQVSELSQKVSQIEEEIKSAPAAKISENTLSTLRSFQKYVEQLGFKSKNRAPMLLDTKDVTPGNGATSFNDDNNTMIIMTKHAEDLQLILESYVAHVLRSQANFSEAAYSWEAGVPFFAAYNGISAYLACSFLNDPKIAYRHASLSESIKQPSRIAVAEQGIEFWGGLFWDIRTLLTQPVADRLVASSWLATQPPQNAADFPDQLVKTLLDTYKSTSDSKNLERLRETLQTRSFKT